MRMLSAPASGPPAPTGRSPWGSRCPPGSPGSSCHEWRQSPGATLTPPHTDCPMSPSTRQRLRPEITQRVPLSCRSFYHAQQSLTMYCVDEILLCHLAQQCLIMYCRDEVLLSHLTQQSLTTYCVDEVLLFHLTQQCLTMYCVDEVLLSHLAQKCLTMYCVDEVLLSHLAQQCLTVYCVKPHNQLSG